MGDPGQISAEGSFPLYQDRIRIRELEAELEQALRAKQDLQHELATSLTHVTTVSSPEAQDKVRAAANLSAAERLHDKQQQSALRCIRRCVARVHLSEAISGLKSKWQKEQERRHADALQQTQALRLLQRTLLEALRGHLHSLLWQWSHSASIEKGAIQKALHLRSALIDREESTHHLLKFFVVASNRLICKLLSRWRERAAAGRQLALIPGAAAIQTWLDKFAVAVMQPACLRRWRFNAGRDADVANFGPGLGSPAYRYRDEVSTPMRTSPLTSLSMARASLSSPFSEDSDEMVDMCELPGIGLFQLSGSPNHPSLSVPHRTPSRTPVRLSGGSNYATPMSAPRMATSVGAKEYNTQVESPGGAKLNIKFHETGGRVEPETGVDMHRSSRRFS